MGKSQETFSKKEKEKKRLQKRKEKEEKKEQRKAEHKKGKSLDEMMAYIDEDGNLSATRPDPAKMKPVKLEDIENGVVKRASEPASVIREGIVSFFNTDKGYGFIRDLQSQRGIFVHINAVIDPIKEKDKVSFEIEIGAKGPAAVRVRKK